MNEETVTNKVKQGVYFAKEVIARLTKDQDKVVANKNARLAIAALTAQTAALTGSIVNQEMAVEAAEEALGNAHFPTVLIASPQAYCDNITYYQNALDNANDDLETLVKSQASFQKLLDKL